MIRVAWAATAIGVLAGMVGLGFLLAAIVWERVLRQVG